MSSSQARSPSSTGASKGIGAAIAKSFAAEGPRSSSITRRSKPMPTKVVSTIVEAGGKALPFGRRFQIGVRKAS